MTNPPLIILDRDGVINEDSDAYIKSVAEWIPIEGSIDAIARLSQHGFRVCIASNQSGLARGLLTIDDLNAIHRQLHLLVAGVGGQIDAIFFCPHAPEQQCDCRKPKPGLFESIRKRLRTDLGGVPFVGDSLCDVLAARAIGAQPILVKTGNGARTIASNPELLDGVPVFDDLAAAVDQLVGEP